MKHTKSKNKIKKESYWLYLHPYVYASIKKNKALLYNTINGKALEYSDEKVIGIIKRLNSDKNLFVIKLKQQELDESLINFISHLRKFFLGDLIDTLHRPGKPIQLKPILNLQKTFNYYAQNGNNSRLLVKDEIKDYINIITIYINEQCMQSCPICESAYKQFLFCHKSKAMNNEININAIKLLLNEIKGSKLYKLNIIGGNIFSHPGFTGIFNVLNNYPIVKDYCIHYLNIKETNLNIFPKLQGDNHLKIFVHFPLDRELFQQSMKLLSGYDIIKLFSFVVQDTVDIKKAEEVASAYEIHYFDLVPYYNGKNCVFFKDNVYLNRESILESKPSMNNILSRTVLNMNDFKKLIIKSNGDIYANLNNPKIGSISKDSVFDLVNKEFHKGKSWTKVRKNVRPCKSCVFNALCPPISNYEYVIGKYNLCDVM